MLPPTTSSPGPTLRGSVRRDSTVDALGTPDVGAEEPGEAPPGAAAAGPEGAGEGAACRPFSCGATMSLTFSAESALVTGWKYVVPPVRQSPLPPEVTPSATPSENIGPPLSPGSAHTLVSISPLTVPSG